MRYKSIFDMLLKCQGFGASAEALVRITRSRAWHAAVLMVEEICQGRQRLAVQVINEEGPRGDHATTTGGMSECN